MDGGVGAGGRVRARGAAAQAPSTNIQHPEKLQGPSSNPERAIGRDGAPAPSPPIERAERITPFAQFTRNVAPLSGADSAGALSLPQWPAHAGACVSCLEFLWMLDVGCWNLELFSSIACLLLQNVAGHKEADSQKRNSERLDAERLERSLDIQEKENQANDRQKQAAEEPPHTPPVSQRQKHHLADERDGESQEDEYLT